MTSNVPGEERSAGLYDHQYSRGGKVLLITAYTFPSCLASWLSPILCFQNSNGEPMGYVYIPSSVLPQSQSQSLIALLSIFNANRAVLIVLQISAPFFPHTFDPIWNVLLFPACQPAVWFSSCLLPHPTECKFFEGRNGVFIWILACDQSANNVSWLSSCQVILVKELSRVEWNLKTTYTTKWRHSTTSLNISNIPFEHIPCTLQNNCFYGLVFYYLPVHIRDWVLWFSMLSVAVLSRAACSFLLFILWSTFKIAPGHGSKKIVKNKTKQGAKSTNQIFSCNNNY